jgi:hypothetical protein
MLPQKSGYFCQEFLKMLSFSEWLGMARKHIIGLASPTHHKKGLVKLTTNVSGPQNINSACHGHSYSSIFCENPKAKKKSHVHSNQSSQPSI